MLEQKIQVKTSMGKLRWSRNDVIEEARDCGPLESRHGGIVVVVLGSGKT